MDTDDLIFVNGTGMAAKSTQVNGIVSLLSGLIKPVDAYR